MFAFQFRGHLKAVDHDTPGVEILEYLTNQTILSGSVHPLYTNQYGILSVGVHLILEIPQVPANLAQSFFKLLGSVPKVFVGARLGQL